MKKTVKREWLFLGAATLMGMILFGGFFAYISWYAGPESFYKTVTDRAPTATYRNLSDPTTGRYVLKIGEEQVIDGTKLVYRGLAPDASCLIDVSILALDPEVAYLHTIKIRAAKLGFRLARKNYRLMSASRNTLRLQLVQGL